MIGIDEVGRGCWAGPLLVVAAREQSELPAGLDDSKKLSKKKRELLFYDITISCDIGEGWVTAAEIDACGLSSAMQLGVARALEALGAAPNEKIIMDGLINYCDPLYTQVECVAKADSLYPIVSAASIYAKVTRDRYMSELGGHYAVYEFAKHVGYGTKLHSDLITTHGVCDMHRVSFAPLKKFATI